MEKSKVLIQFLVIFRQFGDVFFFLYARRLRGYTAAASKFASFGLQLSSDSATSGHDVEIVGTFLICYLLHFSFTAWQIFVFFWLKFAPHLEHFVRLLLCSMIAHTGSVLIFFLIFKHLHSIHLCHQNSSSKATAYCISSPGWSFDLVDFFHCSF